MKTSRPDRAPRARRAAVVLAMLAAASAAHAIELGDVMKLMARRTSGEARFTESRYVHGLDQPLVSTGTLSFTAPDRFERRTLTPRAESMRVQGNQVTLSRGGRSRTLALDATPEAQVAVEAVRGALTGNGEVLQKYFRVKVSGEVDRWTIDLVPLDRGTAGPLLDLRLVGRRGALDTIETSLAGGDHAVMTIEPVASAGAASAP